VSNSLQMWKDMDQKASVPRVETNTYTSWMESVLWSELSFSDIFLWYQCKCDSCIFNQYKWVFTWQFYSDSSHCVISCWIKMKYYSQTQHCHPMLHTEFL
jgi:hypothetical protein